MDKIAFPYRSSSHLVLLHVVAESGAWEKHGLARAAPRQLETETALALCVVAFSDGKPHSTFSENAS
jgi:hypothetical protein